MSSHSSGAPGRSIPAAAGSSSGNSIMVSSRSSGASSLQGVIHSLPNLQPQSSSSSQSQQQSSSVVVKNHVCIHCHKKFKRAQELTVHTRIHTGEVFIQLSQMDIYFIIIYTNTNTILMQSILNIDGNCFSVQKPYSCPVCFKKFSQSSSVTLHLPVHTGRLYTLFLVNTTVLNTVNLLILSIASKLISCDVDWSALFYKVHWLQWLNIYANFTAWLSNAHWTNFSAKISIILKYFNLLAVFVPHFVIYGKECMNNSYCALFYLDPELNLEVVGSIHTFRPNCKKKTLKS